MPVWAESGAVPKMSQRHRVPVPAESLAGGPIQKLPVATPNSLEIRLPTKFESLWFSELGYECINGLEQRVCVP
jgi:hypothetical protein